MKVLVATVVLTIAAPAPAVAQSKVEPPVPVRTVTPQYPADFRRDGVAGVVVVKCSIDEQGTVTEAVVEKSSHNAFEEPALAAVKKWKFKPARKDGANVAIAVSIPIKFVSED